MEVYKKFREADKRSNDYIGQFLGRMGENQKALTHDEIIKIQAIRKEADLARYELDKFFGLTDKDIEFGES